MTALTIVSVASTMGADLKAFRSAAVTADNKATPTARSILAALISGAATPAVVTSAVIHAFGNPKSGKGKPIATLSGLRDLTGGDKVRKTVEVVFDVFSNIDSDKGDDEAPGAAAIRPLVVSFVLNETGAPRSLKALSDGVKALIAAHVAATMPNNDDAKEENEQEEENNATPPETGFDAGDAFAKLMVWMQNASGSDLSKHDDDMARMLETITAAYHKIAAMTGDPVEEKQAA